MGLYRSQDREEAVDLYATAMKRELEANEYKGDPAKVSPEELTSELIGHLQKLLWMIHQRTDTGVAMWSSPYINARILEYAADIGNLAMFMAHNAESLNEATLRTRTMEKDYVPPPWNWEFQGDY